MRRNLPLRDSRVLAACFAQGNLTATSRAEAATFRTRADELKLLLPPSCLERLPANHLHQLKVKVLNLHACYALNLHISPRA